MHDVAEDDVCKEVSVNIDGEETRIVFVDHQHGEMSVGWRRHYLLHFYFLFLIRSRTSSPPTLRMLSWLSLLWMIKVHWSRRRGSWSTSGRSWRRSPASWWPTRQIWSGTELSGHQVLSGQSWYIRRNLLMLQLKLWVTFSDIYWLFNGSMFNKYDNEELLDLYMAVS